MGKSHAGARQIAQATSQNDEICLLLCVGDGVASCIGIFTPALVRHTGMGDSHCRRSRCQAILPVCPGQFERLTKWSATA